MIRNKKNIDRNIKTLDRQLLILEKLQVAPRFITVRGMKEMLAEDGHDITERQVQRILNYYEDKFGLLLRTKSDTAGRPANEWAWDRKKGAPNLQPFDPPMALTFELSNQLLAPILPGPFMQQMEKDLRRARILLRQTSLKARRFPQKVRVIPRGLGRLQATVDANILNKVYQALLTEMRIRVSYGSQAGDTPNLMTHELSPLGLVIRFDTLYLVHVRESETNQHNPETVMEWPLHRFRSVDILTTPIRVPRGFDLDTHLKHPGFLRNRIPENLDKLGPEIKLRLLLSERTARYVRERPFGDDQRANFQEDGRVLVTATAPNTREVISELLNFADDVEVLGPEPLRDYFRVVATKLYHRYKK